MSDFDPGEGWRLVRSEDGWPEMKNRIVYYGDSGPAKVWVREEPVPPLPTEPYTVIRVTVKDWGVVDWWRDPRGNWRFLPDGDLVPNIDITGFEVLAEPRATWGQVMASAIEYAQNEERRETAKAVIDWFAKNVPLTAVLYQGAVREFGVSDG